jgi:RNA polymerase primary sigma factor
MKIPERIQRLVEGRGINSDHLVMVVELGMRRGKLTKEEIIQVIPEFEFDGELFRSFIDLLRASGIEVNSDGDLAGERIDFHEGGDDLMEIPPEQQIVKFENEETTDIDNIMQIYLQEATRVPLLSAADEVELAKRIELCRSAYEEIANLKGQVSQKRMEELRRRIEEGKKARDRLIRANTRLVISVARRYLNRGLPLPDLIQEGNIGLMRAVHHFDYQRGFRFSTYATWWIRQAVTRGLSDQGRTIRLPAYISDQVTRLRKIQSSLQQKFGRLPTYAEISEAMGFPVDRVEAMINSTIPLASLESPVGEDSEEELGDVLEDRNALDPEEAAASRMDRESLVRMLDRLPPRERDILRMRYGLEDREPLTLTEIGERLGITRERARQLETQAINRLRHPEERQRAKGKRKHPGN